jgi:hypothetical protein
MIQFHPKNRDSEYWRYSYRHENVTQTFGKEYNETAKYPENPYDVMDSYDYHITKDKSPYSVRILFSGKQTYAATDDTGGFAE